jgi:hypothetical protein
MNTVKVTRQEMIEALTRHDLEWLASGNATTKDLMDDCVKFFAEGGFTTWADHRLIALYSDVIAPEDATVGLEAA